MIFGAWLTATIPAGGATSDEIDLGQQYDFINVALPGLDPPTGFNVAVSEQGASSTGAYATYRELDPSIITDETSGGINDSWRIGGYRYIKLVAQRSQSQSRTIRVQGFRE